MPQPVIHLDRRVSIDEEVVTKDPVYSANTPTWRLLGTFAAEVVDALPSRSLAVREGLAMASRSTRVRVRYLPLLATQSRKRIRFGGRTLQVVGGPSEMGRREFLEFATEEPTTTGGA